MSDTLLTKIDGPVATITFNRPEVMNALAPETTGLMREFFVELEANPKVRCVVLRGAGDNFMAGGDVKSFAKIVNDIDGEERRRQFEKRIHELHGMVYAMHRLRVPVIASVQGAAAGFGLSLVLAADLAIAADNAVFTLAYVRIGTSPDGSSSYFMPRIVGLKKAMEFALLGDIFDAEEAKRLGVVNYVVPAAELEDRTAELAARFADGPAHCIGNIKELFNASLGNTIETQLQMEGVQFADCAATDDWAEGVTAFAEKRKPEFKGK